MKRGIYNYLLLVCIALSLSTPAFTAQSSTVLDMAGRRVSLSGQPARIICLSPGTLRLAVYLQAEDLVVGMEDMEKKFPTTRPYYIANPEFAELPSIGPGGPQSINKEPDYEKILAVKPDILFTSYMEGEPG